MYKGNFFAFAESFFTAIDTASIALAPKFVFCLVPSKLINNVSIRSWLWILWPFNFLEIFVFTKLTAVKTLFPRYLLFFVSLFSNASNVPVDAPDGQIAEALLFFIKTSASTVGFPLLSNTWRAFTFKILLTIFLLNYRYHLIVLISFLIYLKEPY